jgi:hypothetical protein
MKAEPAEVPANEHPHQVDFGVYPLHKVVSVFTSADDMEAAFEELNANGFSKDDIEAFCGVEQEKRSEIVHARRGVWSAFLMAIQHLGPDRTYIERYEEHLKKGHCLIMVTVGNKLKKERAARILHKHTGERVTYFGLLSASEIK